jgi:hypothetical protein
MDKECYSTQEGKCVHEFQEFLGARWIEPNYQSAFELPQPYPYTPSLFTPSCKPRKSHTHLQAEGNHRTSQEQEQEQEQARLYSHLVFHRQTNTRGEMRCLRLTVAAVCARSRHIFVVTLFFIIRQRSGRRWNDVCLP